MSLGEVVGGTASVEREPITGSGAEAPSRVQGQSPGWGSEGEAPAPETESILTVERLQETANLHPLGLLYFAKSVNQRSPPRRSASIPYVSHVQVRLKYPTFLWLQWNSFVTGTVVIGAALSRYLLTVDKINGPVAYPLNVHILQL